MAEEKLHLDPGLYVTATPIGNLGDITYRAVAALKAADLILCEDTRQTAKLCAAYDIKTPRTAYHEHNAQAVRPDILRQLQDGARICLVSDAGTPLIADPGYKLVREARDAGIAVSAIPGASAAIAALSAAGAPTDRFTFAGFPPAKSSARRKFYESLQQAHGCLVFYESANRIVESLADLASVFGGEQPLITARELTKLHEEFRQGSVSKLQAEYAAQPPKGEFVVLLPKAEQRAATPEETDAFIRAALQEMSVKEAATAAAEAFGCSRREAYARALELKKA